MGLPLDQSALGWIPMSHAKVRLTTHFMQIRAYNNGGALYVHTTHTHAKYTPILLCKGNLAGMGIGILPTLHESFDL